LTKTAIDPFEQEFGIKVEQSSHGNEEEALAKMRAAGPSGYNVITVNKSGLYIEVKQGLFAELQLENIPNYRYLIPKLQRPRYDPRPGIHSVPDVYGSNAITYNTKYLTRLDSCAVCWDPSYAKHIAVRDSAIYRTFLTAL
jgi:spermidine/putrescine transport system substrate-binding protein